MLAPSASVFRIRPPEPGSERMFAPWPLVLPTCPRAGRARRDGGGRPRGGGGRRQRLACRRPARGSSRGCRPPAPSLRPPGSCRRSSRPRPGASRTFRQMIPSTVRSGPTTSTRLPSGIGLERSPPWPGSRRRFAPSAPVFATWSRWPTPCGVGVGAFGGGVDVAKIWATDEATVGEASDRQRRRRRDVWAPGRTIVSTTKTRPAVSATASAAASPSPIHWARGIGRGRARCRSYGPD